MLLLAIQLTTWWPHHHHHVLQDGIHLDYGFGISPVNVNASQLHRRSHLPGVHLQGAWNEIWVGAVAAIALLTAYIWWQPLSADSSRIFHINGHINGGSASKRYKS